MLAKRFNSPTLRGAIAAAAVFALPVSAIAQIAGEEPAAPDESSTAGLNLPANPQILGHNDPNHRKATAKVNGEVITGTDVDQRLALIVAANKGKISPDELQRLRLQVLRNLIDETLEIQEAKASDVEVSNAEVDDTYNRVAQQNFGKTPKELADYLATIGSSPASLKRQIKGEMSWQRLLRRNVAPFINVSEEEVREVMDRLKAAKGTEEYRIGEIFLSANDVNQQQVQANAQQIVDQIKKGGSFVAYARQYSQASTAAVGGDLGWIRLAQLPPELANIAKGMQAGQLVGPVPVRGGYDILYMIDKRQVLTADPRDAVLSLKQISLDFPADTDQQDAAKKVQLFTKTVQSIKGCGEADAAAQSIGATVVENDQVKARDLPGPLQEAVLSLNVGQATPPFGSLKEGVRVLMLCGRDDPKVDDGPSFDQMMSKMEDDRINKRAQTYLRDLRRDAVIEYD
ncbi:peptidylprolyl isomerase [Novosphingobium sp. ZN18A2]|uniref:peptidylprolyl isomerase n=1 Tax=Novosphingobium sp. ZN18A2 TaxID=3079861 RepID=UPI0030CF7070